MGLVDEHFLISTWHQRRRNYRRHRRSQWRHSRVCDGPGRAEPNTDADGDIDGNTNAYADSNGYSYSDTDADTYPYARGDADAKD